jgi:hypothetical protein
MYGEPQPYWEQSKEVDKEVTREQVLGEGLNEWELSEDSGLTSEEQELSRLQNTSKDSGLSEQELSRLNHIAPQSVYYIVAWIIVFVLVIVGLVLFSVFH